jgi:hypothetical protein
MLIHKSLMVLTLGLSGMAAIMAQPASVTRNTSFPPVGVALMETMQVNLFNQATTPPTTMDTLAPPVAPGTAASCTGSVSFLDANGKEIGTATNFTVASGDTQSISLLGSKANASTTTGARAEVRAVVSLTTARGTPCSLVQSLETFDSTTGATHVYVQGGTLGGFAIPGFGRN